MSTPDSKAPRRALEGIKLVELSCLDNMPNYAAATAGKSFADHGAEVIKIEPPRTGAPERLRGPFKDELPDPETGGAYTLKRWRVTAAGPDGGAAEIELRPDNPGFKPIRMQREDGVHGAPGTGSDCLLGIVGGLGELPAEVGEDLARVGGEGVGVGGVGIHGAGFLEGKPGRWVVWWLISIVRHACHLVASGAGAGGRRATRGQRLDDSLSQ